MFEALLCKGKIVQILIQITRTKRHNGEKNEWIILQTIIIQVQQDFLYHYQHQDQGGAALIVATAASKAGRHCRRYRTRSSGKYGPAKYNLRRLRPRTWASGNSQQSAEVHRAERRWDKPCTISKASVLIVRRETAKGEQEGGGAYTFICNKPAARLDQDCLHVRVPLADQIGHRHWALSYDNWALGMVEADIWVVCPQRIVESTMNHFILSQISQRFLWLYEDEVLTGIRRIRFWNSDLITASLMLSGM